MSHQVPASTQVPGLPPGIAIGPLGTRFVAYLVDALVPALIGVLAVVVLLNTNSSLNVVSTVALVLTLLWALLVWWMFAVRGAGPGMRLMHLQLVGVTDGRPIGWGRFLLRQVILSLLAMTGIGLLLMVIFLVRHPRRQGWHDLAVSSVVIRERTAAAPAPGGAAGRASVSPASSAGSPVVAAPGAAPSVLPPGPPPRHDGLAQPQPGLQPFAPAPIAPTPLTPPPGYPPAARPPAPGPAAGSAGLGSAAQPSPGYPRPGGFGPPRGSVPSPGSQGGFPGSGTPGPGASGPGGGPISAASPGGRVWPPAAPVPSPATASPSTASPAMPRPATAGPAMPGPATPSPVPPRPSGVGVWRALLDDGRAIEVDGLILLGRNPQARPGEEHASLIKIADTTRTVSKSHLEIGLNSSGVYVVDRGSTNGSTVTAVNGLSKRCTPGDPVQVEPDSIVSFGDHWLEIKRS